MYNNTSISIVFFLLAFFTLSYGSTIKSSRGGPSIQIIPAIKTERSKDGLEKPIMVSKGLPPRIIAHKLGEIAMVLDKEPVIPAENDDSPTGKASIEGLEPDLGDDEDGAHDHELIYGNEKCPLSCRIAKKNKEKQKHEIEDSKIRIGEAAEKRMDKWRALSKKEKEEEEAEEEVEEQQKEDRLTQVREAKEMEKKAKEDDEKSRIESQQKEQNKKNTQALIDKEKVMDAEMNQIPSKNEENLDLLKKIRGLYSTKEKH